MKIKVEHHRLWYSAYKLYAKLRKSGLSHNQASRFIFKYFEYAYNNATWQEVSPYGGMTVVTITEYSNLVKKTLYGVGIAYCSLEDRYVKKVGYKLALQRALENWHAQEQASNPHLFQQLKEIQ